MYLLVDSEKLREAYSAAGGEGSGRSDLQKAWAVHCDGRREAAALGAKDLAVEREAC